MLELGKKQRLKIGRKVEFGVYLTDGEREVLLPRRQIPEGSEVGDEIEVFLYKDSKDRLISTTNVPYIELGATAVLKVKETGSIGAFLDWGLEKDLLLPFKEQTTRVRADEECLVALYIDKSDRLCATMKVYDYLKKDSSYKKDDVVEGIVYEISEEFGVFVAVDQQYSARIPKQEAPPSLRVCDRIQARVTDVKADGKLDLSIRRKSYLQMDEDAELVMKGIIEYGGVLPFTDKASPEVIKREFGLSKNAFKRAVGRLLKEERIEIGDTCIRSK